MNSNNDIKRDNEFGVSGNSLLLTMNGYIKVKNLEGESVKAWNGLDEQWENVKIVKSTKQRHMITVCLANGAHLTCTPNYIFDHLTPEKKNKKLVAQHLFPGIKIRSSSYQVIDGNQQYDHAYIRGALCSFGCFADTEEEQNKEIILDVVHSNYLKLFECSEQANLNSHLQIPDKIPPIHDVPLNSNIKSKLRWLSGYLLARSYKNSEGINLSHHNNFIIHKIRLMLTTLDVKSSILINSSSNTYITDYLDDQETTPVNLCMYTVFIPWNQFEKLVLLEQKYFEKKFHALAYIQDQHKILTCNACSQNYNYVTISNVIVTGLIDYPYILENSFHKNHTNFSFNGF